MGQKKDIGKLFENKLNDGKRTPNKNLWDKINTSLEEEMRRKKRFFFYWLVGGGISVILGIFLLFSNGSPLKTEPAAKKENGTVVERPNTITDKESNKTLLKNSTENLLNNKNEGEEKLSKIDPPIDNLKPNETEISSKNNLKIKTNQNSPNHKSLDETFTVSKKYYYYNSKDGTQLITNNKNEIDSLVSEQYKSLDSLATKKVDSLRQ